jgi:leucyl/phenylalanyl-tRNA--protein transferase
LLPPYPQAGGFPGTGRAAKVWPGARPARLNPGGQICKNARMLPWIDTDTPFPPLERAARSPNGLLAAGGDLSLRRLLSAYRQGIFPWYSAGDPILWWSPDPRMVLYPDEFKVSHSLAKRVRSGRFEMRIDTAFREVMQHCAATPREGQSGTWIRPEMIEAYCALHAAGYAHSVESWRDGTLVGGLYGLALGRVFFGESMFAHATDASKVALVRLVEVLTRLGVRLIDCQQATPHLASLGARQISRRAFRAQLDQLIESVGPDERWSTLCRS